MATCTELMGRQLKLQVAQRRGIRKASYTENMDLLLKVLMALGSGTATASVFPMGMTLRRHSTIRRLLRSEVLTTSR
ncbi:hypothetical protein AC251_05760 [Ralstonia pseudosolanacearum]|nr:hypothetical protein AC251_05760 [Ralstonia pseudosolanacearum]